MTPGMNVKYSFFAAGTGGATEHDMGRARHGGAAPDWTRGTLLAFFSFSPYPPTCWGMIDGRPITRRVNRPQSRLSSPDRDQRPCHAPPYEGDIMTRNRRGLSTSYSARVAANIRRPPIYTDMRCDTRGGRGQIGAGGIGRSVSRRTTGIPAVRPGPCEEEDVDTH